MNYLEMKRTPYFTSAIVYFLPSGFFVHRFHTICRHIERNHDLDHRKQVCPIKFFSNLSSGPRLLKRYFFAMIQSRKTSRRNQHDYRYTGFVCLFSQQGSIFFLFLRSGFYQVNHALREYGSLSKFDRMGWDVASPSLDKKWSRGKVTGPIPGF